MSLLINFQIKKREIKPSKISQYSSRIRTVHTSPAMKWTNCGKEFSTVNPHLSEKPIFIYLLFDPVCLVGFWMSDKALVQQALASELANLLLTIESSLASFEFLGGFWRTIVREWQGIDRLR